MNRLKWVYTMITLEKIEAVKKAIASGKSSRKIAMELGISRTSVYNVQRGLCRIQRPPKEPSPQAYFDENAPYTRCPTCGGLVKMPCLLCRIRHVSE